MKKELIAMVNSFPFPYNITLTGLDKHSKMPVPNTPINCRLKVMGWDQGVTTTCLRLYHW